MPQLFVTLTSIHTRQSSWNFIIDNDKRQLSERFYLMNLDQQLGRS